MDEVFGIWQEELDGLAPADKQQYVPLEGNKLGLNGSSPIREYAERIHPRTAEIIAYYGNDFYAGEAALTVNKYGKGLAYYQAARGTAEFLNKFYDRIIAEHKLTSVLPDSGQIHASLRCNSSGKYLFVYNFSDKQSSCKCSLCGKSLIDGSSLNSELTLAPYTAQVYLLN